MAASMAIRLPGSPAARRGLPLLLLGLLFACTPGASPGRLLHSSNPNPFCTSRHYLPPASLCFFFEGDPLPGQPFTLTIDAFYGAHPKEPPYTLTLILPAALEVLNLDTSRPYTLHSSIPVSLLDPTQPIFAGRGAFTATGTLIAVDLGRIGQQSLWDPGERRERPGERVRLTLRLSEAGEWQVWGLLHQGERVVRLEWGLLGWSTPSQAYWTDHETAFMRVEIEIKGPQCGGARPCTIRFPYDPYRFALGVPPEAPGRPLWKRPTTFCGSYERPGTCTDYGLPEVSPEDFQPPEERPTPVSPSASSPPPPAAPARWLELSGRIHYRDPLTHAPLPARRVRVELWNEPEPSPSPCSGLPRPTPRPPRVPPPTPPLACRRARLDVTYTGEDGSYFFSVPTAFPLRIVLRVYAQDDQRVTVRPPNPTQAPYFHKTEPIELNPGTHVLNVTIQDEDLGAALFIYDILTRLGWEGLQRQVGWSPTQRLTVYWPIACAGLPEPQRLPPPIRDLLRWLQQQGVNLEPQSCYLPDLVFLREEDGRNPGIILHEFGHFVMDHFPGYHISRVEIDTGILPLPFPLSPSYPYVFAACASTLWNHDPKRHTSPSCAWSEGWASFLGVALKGWDPNSDLWIEDPFGFPDFPHPDPDHPTNADSEWAVAAALWDLFDHLPEPWDPHADGLDGSAHNGIWTLSTQITPQFFLNIRVIVRRLIFSLPIYILELEGDRDGVEAFWAAWKAWRPETICEAGRIFTAHFIPHGPYSLTVHAAPPEGGTARVVAGRACADGAYPEGERVRLQAQPRPGWAFAGWIGADATDPDDTAIVTMTQSRAITATFRLLPTPTPTPSPTPPPTGRVLVTELRFTHDTSYSMPSPQVSGEGFSLVEINPQYFELGSCALGRTCVLYRYQRADPITASPTVDLYLQWSWNPATISDIGAQEPWVKIIAFGGRWDPTIGRFIVDPTFQGVISGTVAAWGWGSTTRVDGRYRRIILELNQGIGQGVELCAEWGGLADQGIRVICPIYGTTIEGTYAGSFTWGGSVEVWRKLRVGTDNPAPVEAAASIRIAYSRPNPPTPPPTPTPRPAPTPTPGG